MPEEKLKDNDSMENTDREEFETPESDSGKGGFFKWVIILIIIAVIIVGGLWLISRYSKFNVLNISSTRTDWQAVFLTNGQVYFGKVAKETDDELVLTEIYYLQITQPLQRSSDQNQQQQGQNELALVKLGNELHGPKDMMYINKDHVLFTEDLKGDSKVVKAIEDSKNQAE